MIKEICCCHFIHLTKVTANATAATVVIVIIIIHAVVVTRSHRSINVDAAYCYTDRV